MSTARIDLDIRRGETFSRVLRWGQPTFSYADISAATQAAPCVLTAIAHGLPDGWQFRVQGAKGMTELNSPDGAYWTAKVRDPDTVEINDLVTKNARPYSGGGVLVYNPPVDLTGYSAALHIRESVTDAVPAVTLVSPNYSPLPTAGTVVNPGVVLDDTANTITVQMPANTTAALAFDSAVYDLELVSADGIVTMVAAGKIRVRDESQP